MNDDRSSLQGVVSQTLLSRTLHFSTVEPSELEILYVQEEPQSTLGPVGYVPFKIQFQTYLSIREGRRKTSYPDTAIARYT